ncbi:hypothetical protein MYU51_011403 [Penicillium brevicompactum]
MSLPENLRPASIITSCANALPDNVISQYGKRVIKISDHQVVKYGPDVTKEEFENQRIAHELVDSRIARVPRVYDFFVDERGWGYIVMEFMKGKVIDPLDDVSLIQRIANMLNHFATLRYDIPGSIYGGPCRGLLFPEFEELVFNSLDQMEDWFNSRLFAHNPTLDLQGSELVLCHLDIAPRNIIWLEDGSLCLIDWASAGFYPRLFEFSMQWILDGKDGDFNSNLLELVEPLSDHEMAQKEAFICAWGNIQRHPFRNKTSASPRGFSRRSTDLPPVPAPPMPDYPPEWYEKAGREYPLPPSPTCTDSSSSVPEDRN